MDAPRFRVGTIHIHEAPIMERKNERKTGTSNLKVQDSDTQWTYPTRILVTVPVPHGTDTRQRTLRPRLSRNLVPLGHAH